ncbi:MAG: hypothetical protein K8S56_05425 [Candidatus Cloacimonetes bacterium]|nr:hypothetical protein [Candidatus Cloacimonadota bacterium]
MKEIKLMIFDCDGVLSDGSIIYDNRRIESKAFSAKDGLGFRLLQTVGIIPAVITGRESQLLAQRCADVGIEHLYQAVANKLTVAEELLKKLGLSWSECAYMGDDWNDMSVIRKAALTAAPADIFPDFAKEIDYICTRPGGKGAVREFIEVVLKKQGLYEDAVKRFLTNLAAR